MDRNQWLKRIKIPNVGIRKTDYMGYGKITTQYLESDTIAI